MNIEERKERLVLLKCMEETDKVLGVDYAQQALENPLLDRNELSQILNDSLTGIFKNKKTGEVVQLENKTLMAGVRNLLNKIDNDCNSKV